MHTQACMHRHVHAGSGACIHTLRLAALHEPCTGGMVAIDSDRFVDQEHNEQRVKSILVQLINEASKVYG